jgi:hypothetical protein
MRITNATNRSFNTAWMLSIGISLTVLCFVFFGCGGSTRSDPYHIAEHKPTGSGKTAVPGKSVNEPSSLPPSAEVSQGRLRPLVDTFKSQQPQNFNALNATTVGRAYSLTMVSNCDLDVLKGFIVKGWAPIVSLRTSSRSQLWAIVGYGTAGEIVLENPVDNRRQTWTESEFKTQWELASASRCALITPGRLDQAKVQMVLDRYLPQSKVEQVTVSRSLQGRARN